MIKVIIVEDDPMVREINERFLRKVDGYTILKSIGTINEGREEIEKLKPNLILLDMFFPNEKGIDLLKWIREKGYNTDVIMITADRDKVTIEESLRYGVFDYLIKPFTFERFKESLDNYKKRFKWLNESEVVEQNTIDLITLKEKDEHDYEDIISEIKGFNRKTFDKIKEGIENMRGDAFTSQELADKIGVSRITARRYLDYLEREGHLLLELEYGSIGRPKNVYREKNTH